MNATRAGNPGRAARGRPEPARLRDLAQRAGRPRRRPRPGHAAAGALQHRPLRARHEPQRLAVHDPAQPVPLRVPQAPPRGRGSGRRPMPARLKVQPEQGARLDFEDFRAALGAAAGRPARGAAPRRRLGLLLRGGGEDLRLRRRHHQEPRQPRPLAPRRHAGGRRRRGSRSGQHDPRRPAGHRLKRLRARDTKTPPRGAAFLVPAKRPASRAGCVRAAGR